MAATSACGDTDSGSYSTVARSIIRLTDADRTPACDSNVRCTNDWHAAQVMPFTGKIACAVTAPSDGMGRETDSVDGIQ